VLDYARAFGVPSAVLRMSCTYGPRQLGTEDQGWVAHFLIRAFDREPITIYGDGRQVRDILYVDDAVEAYVKVFRRLDHGGHAYNLGGGPGNAVSLREVLAQVEALVGRHVEVRFADPRPGDQRYYVSDTRRITCALGLPSPRFWREGLRWLADWVQQSRSARAGTIVRAPMESAP
jgi:CDP-paratose 2-epimerase